MKELLKVGPVIPPTNRRAQKAFHRTANLGSAPGTLAATAIGAMIWNGTAAASFVTLPVQNPWSSHTCSPSKIFGPGATCTPLPAAAYVLPGALWPTPGQTKLVPGTCPNEFCCP